MDQKRIGEYIHRYRKEKGLTQQQLADILHVSNKAVSKWETGVNTPDTCMLVPLSEALGVTVLDILMGSDLDKADTTEINSFATRMSDNLTRLTNKYKVAITITLCIVLLLGAFLASKQIQENNYLKSFMTLKQGDSMEEVIKKVGTDPKTVKNNDQLSYITPSGNVIVNEFSDEGLAYSYLYDNDSNEVIKVIVAPFSGEYRLKDDGSIKLIFENGNYEIKGSGKDYAAFIEQIPHTKGKFSNEVVPDQYSYGYVREFYLDRDNHDVVIMYLGNKDFKVRMGIHMYDFHKY